MKFSKLAFALLLGTSSVAVADPSFVRDHRTQPRPAPIPTAPIQIAPPGYSPWIQLGSMTGAGRRFMDSDAFDRQRFDVLAFAVRGRVHLTQVLVRFADGQEQMTKLDRVLTDRSVMPLIQLAGDDRAIARLVVYTADDSTGTLVVYGRNLPTYPEPKPAFRWDNLGTVASGKQKLKLDANTAYDYLALSASGRVHVKQILIRFEDGQEQHAKLDRVIDGRSIRQVIDLAGTNRRIQSLIVYTDTSYSGELTVHAR
jgi:hypothetical protein